MLPKEAEVIVHEAVAPPLQAHQAAVLAAEVANLVLFVAAQACGGAEGEVDVERVEVTASAQTGVVLGAFLLWDGELVNVQAACTASQAGQVDACPDGVGGGQLAELDCAIDTLGYNSIHLKMS